MSNTIYHFHPETNEYLGQSEGRLDPIDQNLRVPAHATTVAPDLTLVGDNQNITFDGSAWSVVSDYRDYKYWDEATDDFVTIDVIGAEPPTGHSTEQPAPTAEEVKETQRLALKATRDADLNAMTYTFADGKSMQTRPQDLGNINLRISTGVDRDWLMADNTKRHTTVAELQAAVAVAVPIGEAIWQTYMDAVDAL